MFRNISVSLTLLFLLLASSPSFAQKTISLEDIWKFGTFDQETPKQINHLQSGKEYSQIENTPEGKNIVVLTYKDGEQSGYIFKTEWVPEDMHPFTFSKYKLSPDESKVIISSNVEQIYRHSTRADHYIWDRSSKELTRLATGKQMYPHFSPDNKKVGFVQDNNLYYKDLTTGKIHQVTTEGKVNELIYGASDWVYEEELKLTRAYEWSPDSRKLAFLRFDESRVKQFTLQKGGALYPVDYTFKYPKAGEENAIVTVHVYFLDNKETKQLDLDTDREDHIPRIQWTEDPDVLSVQVLNRRQNELLLLLVDVKTGNTRTVLTEKSEQYVEVDDDLYFLKDGKRFIWTSDQDGYNHIYLFNINGKMEKQVTTGEWDVTKLLSVDEQNKKIYYQSAERSPVERHIYSINLSGKNKKQLSSGMGTFKAEFSADHSYYLMESSSLNSPLELHLYDGKDKKVRTVIGNEQLKKLLADYALPEKELFNFTTSEGVELNGWMIKPADFDPDKEYPVLMFVYGGPGSQTATASWDTKNNMWFRYLAQEGYIVASVDNRGTGARGSEFKKMTYKNLGYYETIDQIEAAKYLGKLKYIDEERIAIFGWSYGGYISSLAMFKGGDVFNAAIAVAPVTDWRFYDTIYTERFMQRPQDNVEGYEISAPITYADQLEGDFLLVHGSGDDNVHMQNTLELVSALVNANKQFDLFIYPDKAHGISGGNTRLHLFTKMTNFLNVSLK